MPSYKIYKIDKNLTLDQVKDPELLSKIQANDSDPTTVSKFIESAKKSYKNLSFEPLTKEVLLKIKLEEKIQFQEDQVLWVTREKMIFKIGEYLFIGKYEKKFERLMAIFLRNSVKIKPIEFSNKYLWKIWKFLRKESINSGLQIKLHRVILKNTFLNSDKVKEINIHANDLYELEILESLIEDAERMIAFTYKIKGFEEGKWLTARIDKKGSFLIYGNHNQNVLLKFFELLVQVL